MTEGRRRSVSFTLKHLDYFVATAENGSIKQAAEAISISQPSISAAIAHLEDEFDVQLFVRQHARGLTLTASGRLLLTEAKQLLGQADQLYSLCADGDDALRGKLTIGCLVTLAPMIVPELSQSFCEINQGVELSIVEGDSRMLIQSLRQVSVDLAITYDLQVPDDVAFEALVALPPYVLVSQSHRLAKRGAVKLRDLKTEPMILLDLPWSRQYFFGLFQAIGVQPCIQARSTNQEVVRTMVANGFGFTIANVRPRNLTARDGRKLVALRLEGKHQPMTIGIATLNHQRKAKALIAFEDHCRRMINQQHVPGMNLDKVYA